MPMGGEGPWAISVMWILTGIAFVFVILRSYTRAVVVESFGIDDHVYNFAFILLVCYTAATTVSAHYGFGQNMADIAVVDDLVKAILFEAIGQTFAVIGMAVAKWSLGLFLLRLVSLTWHKVAIWITMGSLMAASISVCFVFWLQCTPPAYLYDRRIPGGYCHINTTPVSFTLCILCVVADFFFALFPWIFLWSLQMNPREKVIIAGSLSLGLFAGACGIKRTIEVPSLSSSNYLYDTVGLIVWSAAEIAVTMVCIGIPVCRPLYKRWLDTLSTYRSKSASGASGYRRQKGGGASGDGDGNSHPGPVYGLRTFGGSTMPGASQFRPEPPTTTEGESSSDAEEGPAGGSRRKGKARLHKVGVAGVGTAITTNTGAAKPQDQDAFRELRLGINGPFNEATAVGGADWNGSEEEILGSEFRSGGAGGAKRASGSRKRLSDRDLEAGRAGRIQVTDEWRIDRSGLMDR